MINKDDGTSTTHKDFLPTIGAKQNAENKRVKRKQAKEERIAKNLNVKAIPLLLNNNKSGNYLKKISETTNTSIKYDESEKV